MELSRWCVLVLLTIAGQASSPLRAQDSAPITIIDSAPNAPQDSASKPAMASDPTGLTVDTLQSVPALMQQAMTLYSQGKPDDALVLVNRVLLVDATNGNAFILRGAIYTGKKLWDQAEKDFQAAQQLDAKNKSLTYDLADLKFKEQKYDEARKAFVPLQDDFDTLDVSDLVRYKIFLCDLFGNHDDLAVKELDAFDHAGANPSYYFGNCAWDIIHKKPAEAKGWLDMASHLYSARKQKYYSSSLEETGYLPLPATVGGN